MAIKQSPWALFKQTAARPLSSGALVEQEFFYDASAGLLAADIVDLGVLPAMAKIIDAYLYADVSLGTANATVGVMSGDVGSTDAARTNGSQIFSAAAITSAHTALVRMTNPAAPKLAAGSVDRSIGLQVSADIAAGAGKIIRLVLIYTL